MSGSSVFDGGSTKTPIAQNLHRLTEAKANDSTQLQGKSLPCTIAAVISPWIVTVNFEVDATPTTLPKITIPVAMPSYIALPLQVGDRGVAVAANVRLGQQSGLGAGTPLLHEVPANLATLMFVPLGNSGYVTPDATALCLMGNIIATQNMLSFFAAAKVAKQSVTGALSLVLDSNAKAVLTSLIAALTNYGLIINNTT